MSDDNEIEANVGEEVEIDVEEAHGGFLQKMLDMVS